MLIYKSVFHGGPKDGEESHKAKHVRWAAEDRVTFIPDPDHRVATMKHRYRLARIDGTTAHYEHYSAKRTVPEKKSIGEFFKTIPDEIYNRVPEA